MNEIVRQFGQKGFIVVVSIQPRLEQTTFIYDEWNRQFGQGGFIVIVHIQAKLEQMSLKYDLWHSLTVWPKKVSHCC